MDEAQRLGIRGLALSTQIVSPHLAKLQLLVYPRRSRKATSGRNFGMHRHLRPKGVSFGLTGNPEDNLP